MVELTNEQLAAMAAPHDEHAMFKEQGKRQVASVLAAIRPTPEPPATIEAAREAVDALETQLAEAHRAHSRAFHAGQTFGTDCQKSLAAIQRLNTSLHIARGHLALMKQAEASRAARNEQLLAA